MRAALPAGFAWQHAPPDLTMPLPHNGSECFVFSSLGVGGQAGPLSYDSECLSLLSGEAAVCRTAYSSIDTNNTTASEGYENTTDHPVALNDRM